LREVAAAKRDLEKNGANCSRNWRPASACSMSWRQRSQLEERSVVVTLKGAPKPRIASHLHAAGRYVGAGSRAARCARWKNGGAGVACGRDATSGEDWTGVNLALSTQRSTETLKIPSWNRSCWARAARLRA